MRLTNNRINELRKTKRFRHWLDQYALIELFRKKNDRFPKSKEDFPKGNKLGKWYHDINRDSYRKGYLKRWQVYLLNKFNYVFEPPNRWEQNYLVLKNGWKKHPESWPYVYYYTPNLKRIEKWCKDQRLYYKNGKLSGDKLIKLNAINFTWMQPGDVAWLNHYNELAKWIKKHHHLPSRSSKNDKELFYIRWLAKERSKSNKRKLNAERKNKIELICRKLKYDPMRIGWDNICSLYLKWYTENGRRPKKYSKNALEGKLGRWIVQQNGFLNNGKLSKNRTNKLIALNKNVNYQGKKTA